MKHTHHPVCCDKPGSDTSRHRASGAESTLLVGPGFCTLWTEEVMDPVELAKFVGRDQDLVLVEGYKSAALRRIEVVRDEPPVLPKGEAWLTVSSDETLAVMNAVMGLLEGAASKPN